MTVSRNDREPSRPYPVRVALRCLIVDDNPGFLNAARALLEQEGMCVVGVASNDTEAVRQVADLSPDVTLLDIDLGSASGFDVARRLVEDPGVDPGQLIMVSAYAEDDFLELIEASPAIGFLRKPVLSVRAIEDLLSATGHRIPEPEHES